MRANSKNHEMEFEYYFKFFLKLKWPDLGKWKWENVEKRLFETCQIILTDFYQINAQQYEPETEIPVKRWKPILRRSA